MKNYRILERFRNISVFTEEKLEEYCKDIIDVLEFTEDLINSRDELVMRKDYLRCRISSNIEFSCIKSIALHFQEKFGVILFIKTLDTVESQKRFDEVVFLRVEILRDMIAEAKQKLLLKD